MAVDETSEADCNRGPKGHQVLVLACAMAASASSHSFHAKLLPIARVQESGEQMRLCKFSLLSNHTVRGTSVNPGERRADAAL